MWRRQAGAAGIDSDQLARSIPVLLASHAHTYLCFQGNVTISNDGATIMKKLEIVHPAAKVLVDISLSQDAEVRTLHRMQQHELGCLHACVKLVSRCLHSASQLPNCQSCCESPSSTAGGRRHDVGGAAGRRVPTRCKALRRGGRPPAGQTTLQNKQSSHLCNLALKSLINIL